MKILHPKRGTCLFTHFNQNGNVSPYVFTYLESLIRIGLEIVLISNSEIQPDVLKQLNDLPGCRAFVRDNKGIDFGAWQWALKNDLVPADTENILLANDSIFGPLFDLSIVFDKMEAKKVDFWGLTDSYQGQWHIQSYFLYLSRKVFLSDAFKKVFDQDFGKLIKNDIINQGEIQLSQSLKESGFSSAVYVSYDELTQQAVKETHNPTHFYWKQLIREFKFPFLKKDLIVNNPEQFANIMDIFPVIEKETSYNIDQITNVIAERDHKESLKDTNLRPLILCHMFFPDLAFGFIQQLKPLLSYQPVFVFNISATLNANKYFREILRKTFPGCIITASPNKGRDIGGKFFGLNLVFQLKLKSDITLVIHDKKSQHLGNGELWRDELSKITRRDHLPVVFRKFADKKEVGIICSNQFIQNEYNEKTSDFFCTSTKQIKLLMKEYEIQTGNYDFVAGNIFWIRTHLLEDFFSDRSLFSIRSKLEAGNALDFGNGTFIHSWERIMSWIATSQGYTVHGI
jgi:lipopolysaccharide biosynthesis protein